MRVLILSIFLLLSSQVFAGSQAPSKAVFSPEEIVAFAKHVERYAASKGAHAFIIGRTGRPTSELPKGIQYTHTAVAVYSAIQLQSGETEYGYAIHNLYQRANQPGKSDIIVDYPVDFFWGAQVLQAGIVIPTPSVQQKLVNLIAQQKHLGLHNPKYSVVANPFNSKRQNCTEYTLDMLQSAIYNTSDTRRIKANNKAYFNPQTVHMSRMKLALGSLVSDGVSLSDHNGKVRTATFTTIANYLHHYELATDVVDLTPDTQI